MIDDKMTAFLAFVGMNGIELNRGRTFCWHGIIGYGKPCGQAVTSGLVDMLESQIERPCASASVSFLACRFEESSLVIERSSAVVMRDGCIENFHATTSFGLGGAKFS